MKYLFNINILMGEPYIYPIKAGYAYKAKIYNEKFALGHYFCPDDYADVMSAAFESGFEEWKKSGDAEKVFIAARRAADREFRRLITPLLIHSRPEPTDDELHLLPIARCLYAKLAKKGKRGRRSAAIKAFIIREKCLGHSFKAISDNSTVLNERHHSSHDNAKRHWYSAWALLLETKRGNIAR